MNSPKQSEANYWRDRYAAVLDELEQRKSRWLESERLLVRVISRVAAASIGLDSAIEPQLAKIRSLVRKGTLSDAMQVELDEVSGALFEIVKQTADAMESPKPRAVTGDYAKLFDFISTQLLRADEQGQLSALRQRAEQGAWGSDAAAFAELGKLLEGVAAARAASADRNDKPGLLGRLFGAGKKVERKIDLEAIQRNLIMLLEAVDTPLAAQSQANRLLSRLRRDIDVEGFLDLLQDVVKFLAEIKSSAEVEQKSLEQFLSELSRKLIELEHQTVGVQELTKAAEEGSATMHATVVDHVESLRSTTSNATELGALKLLLSSRLDVISGYLSSAREQELERIRAADLEMAKLTGRLQDLESETAELRTRLRVEHSMALRDCLTSLPNRLAYNERLEQEVSRWRRFRHPFCLLIWDIDHFKSINDRFGHSAGDKALITIGEELASSIRETDFVARLGGEEFVMILSGADIGAAQKVAEAIRAKVENCGFNSQGKPVQITISCGISEYQAEESLEELFERADRCLYRAKHEGRNRCIAG